MAYNKNIVHICLLFAFITIQAQDKIDQDQLYRKLWLMENNVLVTKNPASVIGTLNNNMGYFELGYIDKSGDYKKTLSPEQVEAYSAETEQYHLLGKSILKGKFKYQNSKEYSNFRNTTTPYLYSPYLFIDTIGNDKIKTESYFLEGLWSYQLSSKVKLGSTINYTAGISSQDNDPRTSNNVNSIRIRSGIHYKTNKPILGIQLGYHFCNEEIETKTFKENSEHTLYSLTGLGSYSNHTASSFARLYKNNIFNSSIELVWPKNVFMLSYNYSKLNIDDGRRSTDATWATIKNVALKRTSEVILFNQINKSKDNNLQHYNLEFSLLKSVGLEYIQNLEKKEDWLFYNWVNYAEEDKYENQLIKASFEYMNAKKGDNYLSRWLKLKIEYSSQNENYFFPDSKISFENLFTSFDLAKTVEYKKQRLSLEIGSYYNKNLSNSIHLSNENLISDKVIIPDFIYQTSDFIGLKGNLYGLFHLSKLNYPIYVNYSFSWGRCISNSSFNKSSRSNHSVSIGIVI